MNDSPAEKRGMYSYIKRLLDIIFSLIALVPCIPIFLIIAIVIKIDSKGPVFFNHKRVGYHGKPITILKFRTMVEGAEELINDFSEEQRLEWEANFKLEDDPRLTRVGKFLRKSSLDELPQILDILIGKMSFIGPRPLVEDEFVVHDVPKAKYTSLRPGLTGYWACNGRSNLDYEERIKLELYYVDNVSFLLDVRIVFMTIKAVLTAEGAK